MTSLQTEIVKNRQIEIPELCVDTSEILKTFDYEIQKLTRSFYQER
jgi:hypothetical protein